MILQLILVNVTRKLDILINDNKQSISSHSKDKENCLKLLTQLNTVPNSEYITFVNTKDYSILVGYLFNNLCKLAAHDKSRSIRLLSLEILLKFTSKLESVHDTNVDTSQCSIEPIKSALPGVSSTLFKLIMSDTKLPKDLIILSLRTLSKFITNTFSKCDHQLLTDQDTIDICDNLTIRLSFLIDYITTKLELIEDIRIETLNLCEAIVCKTDVNLLNKSIKTLVKYLAFVSAKELKPETKLKIMLINDSIYDKISNSSDYEVISCLLSIIDELEENNERLLSGERQSRLMMLNGLFRLIPKHSMTTIFETRERREQFVKIFTQMTEFSSDQPFLYLTDVEIGIKALESINEKLYTFQRRFKHITNEDFQNISDICSSIGENLSILCLNDLLRNDLRQFIQTSNLLITNSILKGCLKRNDINPISFTKSNLSFYMDKIHEGHIILNEDIHNNLPVDQDDILKVVIAIETVITLMEVHTKNLTDSDANKTIALKDLLCYMLTWASSSSRAISETSFVALNRISQLYGKDSTKSLIEANVDYIVEGVMQMLDNFAYNTDVVNVLAITFKLSTIECFYYFRDVYEKVFRLLITYHSTTKSKYIALLFFRTVSILNDWKKTTDFNQPEDRLPLNSCEGRRCILKDLDVKRRLEKLQQDKQKFDTMRLNMKNFSVVPEVTEAEIIREIQSGQIQDNSSINNDKSEDVDQEKTDTKKNKPVDIELAEKILKHCVNLASSNYNDTKILALKTASLGFFVLQEDENTLLPLVHQLWSPIVHRLTKEYNSNLELNLCAFECLISMAICAKDFIKGRTLESIIPKLCLFLESQANQSVGKKDYGPYCMTVAYKCQLKVLTHLGALAYHIELAYSSLWQVIRATLTYLDQNQPPSLREAAKSSLVYLMALDADCLWYFAKQKDKLKELPFELIYEL